MSNTHKGKDFWVGLIFIIFLSLGMVSCLGSCGGSSNSHTNSRTCKVCHRTFTDSSNTMNIAKTNMCLNCYRNFQYGQKMKGN